MSIIEKAMQLALEAHEGQTRKDSDTPYITHPVAVALLVARYGFSETVIASALVHDVLEDTDVTYERLAAELGESIAHMVLSLTHNNALPWEEKKLGYIRLVEEATDEVKAISTADKIINAQSLLEAYAKNGQKVWSYFNASREKKLWFEEAMLLMLQQSWKHELVLLYAEQVEKLRKLV